MPQLRPKLNIQTTLSKAKCDVHCTPPSPIRLRSTTITAMADNESRTSLYRVLQNRFRDLEMSHAKLRRQFEGLLRERGREQRKGNGSLSDSGEVVSDSGKGGIPGFFSSRSPYENVLMSMGHAVHICRASSGEIIYWNRSAEKLYGWKDYEVLGQRFADLLIDEGNYASVEKIMERLRAGRSWSGQFPFKKRSGEIFSAIATKSPLYEDGELLGVIIVSSDAAMFNNINSENDQDRAQCKERWLNMKKIQWQSQPQIASSVSNLASKVFSRRRGDDTCNACGSIKNRGDPVLDTEDVESETPAAKPSFGLHIGKSTTEGKSFRKDESGFEISQPSKIAAKVLAKLQIGGRSNDAQENCKSVRPHGSADISAINKVKSAPTSPRGSREMNSDDKNIGTKDKGAFSNKGNCINATKIANLDGNGHRIHCVIEEDSSATNKNPAVISWLEYRECPGRLGIPFPRLGLERDGKDEAQPCQDLEAEDTKQQEPEFTQAPVLFGSGGSTGSGSSHGNSSNKGDKEARSMIDCEIHWEDLHVGEEIGQGSFAVVHRGIWNGSDVAVKVYFGCEYRDETLLDYKKEIDIMKRLRHPNVLLFMGAVYSTERLAIVTEFLPRGSLFKTLHRNNQVLDIRRRLRMALDVARGMNYLHHRNPPVVHRDLKSSNLLVDRNWTVKVGDFGLSKLKDATFLTAKSGRGTPQWMAPEVLRNEPSNEKSDVFSFGVILWELMTESIPWSSLNSLQVVGVVGFMDRRLDLPEGLDPQISSIIRDCWRSDPKQRPSFEDIIHKMRDLIQLVAGLPPQRTSES
ncbi:hypothetical protein HHK36_001087 [Tetracentron sinense]|uniref:non-specific serine/threonine protein kinase n=1 Tax=Tetracentron sinense TaxID=13715 RepID=A0A834ZTD2_TETSI|nr:hypothetical protein HHK36_001087 [Tetracentron sinense]